ncbi:unnamed protein product [Urochloa decumbens]|uniref:Receptor kinase-like protein Xa21 n=1 Tax=Urochloa decumbens TaxID=240449 RepID=A0ABC8VG94_9POAL
MSHSKTMFRLGSLVLAYLLTLPSLCATMSLHHGPNNDLQALLCLKLHLSDPAGILASWNNTLQFCSWFGVTCSKRHQSRVVALNLGSLELSGQIPPCISNLTFLARIHLPNNQLSGQIPAELGQLSKLQYLNFRSNNIGGMIPSTLASCFNIRIIDLEQNMLVGGIPEEFGMLRSLSVLCLSTNSLTGNIPISLGSSSSLVSVDLANNSLTGSIPPLLANSSSLRVLSLTNNQLGGEIPPSLFNSTSLQTLAIGMNSFVGSVPVFSNIGSPLQYLVLQSNYLTGTIPSTLGNFSSLRWLLLGDNNFHGSIPTSIGKLAEMQELDMTYNILSANVPISIYNMSELAYLGMGVNSLSGEIPNDIGHTLPRISTLIMQENELGGRIPTSLANTTNLQVINLRRNAFSGIIPSFGTLPNLIELNLGKNRLEAGGWSFLSSLTNCTQLHKLYLDGNILDGVLPNSIEGLSKSLEVLLLNSNRISGSIPQGIKNLRNLKLLHIEQNLLSGNLPYALGELPNLFVLSLSQNRLCGLIPRSIGNLSQLSELYLQNNTLSGPIPQALGNCKNLEMLNLSCNDFNGSIPKQLFTLSTLSEGLDLSHNQLSGQIPQEIGGLINLGLLNISSNKLSGQIPSSIGECVHLESLHMERNLLDGRIPDSFTTLRGIIEMDLSQNNLSGKIPEFFDSFTSITLLNLSFNNLEGPVPTSGVFQNAREVFIQGNKKLCADTPLLHLPSCSVDTLSKRRKTYGILKIVGFVALCLVLLSCFVVILVKKRKKTIQGCHNNTCKELNKFSYVDLVKATNGFSLANLIGSGKYGAVYKGICELEEHTVAIKVFKLEQLGAPESFLTECEVLRNTRHRNLVKVITACSTFNPTGQEFKALVIEYMANGSLESWLYPKLNKYGLKRPLSLRSRIIIAADIASSLDYLHNHCKPAIVHCDLKPSNVLLDDFMVAHVADFGLAKFLHDCSDSTSLIVGPRGSIGYIAPEYGFGKKISREGDIYSYGIIILELLTGKRPTDEMFNAGLSLHKFVERALPHNIGEILDPNIIPNLEDDDMSDSIEHGNHATVGMMTSIMRLVELGLSCSMETPKERPTMQDVYAQVIAIKEELPELCS